MLNLVEAYDPREAKLDGAIWRPCDIGDSCTPPSSTRPVAACRHRRFDGAGISPGVEVYDVRADKCAKFTIRRRVSVWVCCIP